MGQSGSVVGMFYFRNVLRRSFAAIELVFFGFHHSAVAVVVLCMVRDMFPDAVRLGMGWSLFAYRFLREINPVLPFLLAPVISLYPAVFAFFAGWVYRLITKNRKFPECSCLRDT